MTHTRTIAALATCILALAGCQPEGDAGPSDTAAPPPPSALSSSDALLLASARIALPPVDFDAASLPEPSSTGATLLVRYCGQCHAVPSPTMHSATDWPRILRRMWLRMDHLPDSLQVALPEVGDRNMMSRYLMENALQVSAGDLPAGKGRETFATLCSQCHTLPDPFLHSGKDWVGVFQRMELNMERMGVRRPDRTETEAVLSYLQDLPPRTP